MLFSHEMEIFSLYLFSNEICTMNFQTCKHSFLLFFVGAVPHSRFAFGPENRS